MPHTLRIGLIGDFNPQIKVYQAIPQALKLVADDLGQGVDGNGEPRVIELVNHPFFIGTLFQPERSAFTGKVHPLIKAYVQTATARQY